MCVLDGPCIETTEKLNIDQKKPKTPNQPKYVYLKKKNRQ